MPDYPSVLARTYAPGIGDAVADRTINRTIRLQLREPRQEVMVVPRKDDMALDAEVAAYAKSHGFEYDGYHVDHGDGDTVEVTLNVTATVRKETWADVAERVAVGSALLNMDDVSAEFPAMHHHLRQASILMSGRHLQHGDDTQPTRPQEVFTNCSTSAASFLTFYLLLNGSGVGRAYDDAMMKVDYSKMPTVVPAIDTFHKDCLSGEIKAIDPRSAQHLYRGSKVTHFMVPDSREGWAKAIEQIDLMTFQERSDEVLLLDFSQVRPRGAPIKGMQDRPASGPGPLMDAIVNLARLKGTQMAPWRQAMYADHYLAECVLVGGARRAARMATKTWRDANVFDFIHIKRPLEYLGKTPEEIEAYQKEHGQPMGFLWSSNNSVTVDEEFWEAVMIVEAFKHGTELTADDLFKQGYIEKLELHAYKVLEAIAEASYYDGTGEPGLINQEKLTQNNEGLEAYRDGDFAGSQRYQLDPGTLDLTKALAEAAIASPWQMITNPCVPGDTPILTSDGYVAIEDVVGKSVEVWNGKEFAPVTPFHTGFNDTLRVELSDGTELRCTPAHKFILHGDRYHQEGERREAGNLRLGDQLAKYSMPVVTGGVTYGSEQEAYSQGFYSGDGNTGLKHSWLYEPKFICQSRLTGTFGNVHDSCERKTWKHGPMREKGWVPVDATLTYCLSWLAGLLDADGTLCTDKEGGQSFQITAIDKAFLLDVRLMLTRMGAQCVVARSHEAKVRDLPDGQDSTKAYTTQDAWRLVIRGFDAWRLVNELGLRCERLQYTAAKPNRDARRFVTVVGIHQEDPCDTYCFTEYRNHTGTFNGIVTGQCGEITLLMLGAYCVIADVVPYHASSDEDAEDAFRVATRALIRTNTMDCLYRREVNRTNRIGVGITGLHEYAYARFGYGWKDIVDEEKSKDFWMMLSRFNRAVTEEADAYSEKLGVAKPHTTTTIKPAGTTSKLFGLTEGAHLPSMREYLRWVQFRNDDPLIQDYRDLGYPVRELKSYNGTTIVGFPTRPEICSLGMGDKLVTAGEATPEEQYQYLRLLEKYWIRGVDESGEPLPERGNQVSYTLKYDPTKVSYEDFKRTLIEGQSTIRCCSVMPQVDSSAYEYQPEQPLPKGEYEKIVAQLKLQDQTVKEDVAFEHVDCGSGACPIDFQ